MPGADLELHGQDSNVEADNNKKRVAIADNVSEYTISLSQVSLENEEAKKEYDLRISKPGHRLSDNSNTSQTNSEKRVSIKYNSGSIQKLARKVNNEGDVVNIQDFKNQANFQYSFYRKLCNMNERIKVFNTNFCNRRTKFQE